MARRSTPEVNAGSMADIAFLLLIFFLVTTTIESDKGISRKLPPIEEDEQETESVVKERNIFEVVIDKEGELLVREETMDISELRQAALDFIDNGGGSGSAACEYCLGDKDSDKSENPKKAVISIEYDSQTKYGKFIAVQNELMAAYNELRDRVANDLFDEDFSSIEKDSKDSKLSDSEKEDAKEKIKTIRKYYPLNISEAKPERG